MSDDALMPAPYVRNGTDNSPLTMFIKHGYGESYFADSLNSEYEMKIDNNHPWSDFSIDSNYYKQIDHSDVLQARYEHEILDSYFDPIKNKMLFSGDEWYFYDLLYNVALDTVGFGTGNKRIKFSYHRVKTFEEWTLQNFGALINGCRGFIHDGDQNRKFPNFGAGNMGVGDHTKLDSNNDIYSNLVGDDFINSEFNTWNAVPYTPFSIFSTNMEIPEDRIYIGTKSTRDALYQFNTFVRAAEGTLMKLKLAATFSKGYRELYAQDEDIYGTDTLLNDFVEYDKNGSYTKRLYQRFPGDSTFEESYDSSFFNMTILKEDNVPLNDVFYISVQNRRTDPLVYYTNPLDTSQKYLKFFSSAEFRDSCIDSPNASLYDDYWWKRLGAREFTIPFNYRHSNSEDYNLLRISELGSNVDSLNSLWHRDPKYYDLVTDTVIGQDKPLSFRLLPGQGKIFKVEVLKPDIVEGFLDNYNQNNLIEYRDILDTNMIVYHLAFYKNSKRPNDTSKVYKEVHYIRSYPIARNSTSENIIWDSTSRVNLSKQYFESINIINPKYDDCNHPALVVREDSSGFPHPYIVYTCKDSAVSHNDSAKVILAKISPLGGVVLSNQEIFKLSFNDIEKFGTPTINASADGNYIAWTDSLRGLMVAYQKKDDLIPTAIDSIKINEFSIGDPTVILYPSFNTYSHIDNGENNAGLVWYQGHTIGGSINYSRIYYDAVNDSLKIILPPNYTGRHYYGSNSKTMHIAPALGFSGDIIPKPIIFRSLGSYSVDGIATCQYNSFDNINWIDHFTSPFFSQTIINGFTVYHSDTNHVNQSWSTSSNNNISFSGFYKDIIVNSINSAQQDGIILDTTEVEGGGNFNINFTVDSAAIYQMPGLNGSNILKKRDNLYTVYYPFITPRKASVGNMVQLAKSKSPNFQENHLMWKNRRVFETNEYDSLDNPIIKSSANLFYKATHTETMMNHVYFGFTSDSNNIYFDLPKLEGDNNSISSFPIDIDSYPNRLDPCKDVLSSGTDNSFITLGLILEDDDNDGDREMEISIYGHRNSDINIILERASDSAQVVLTMPTITPYPANATKLIYSILDSTNSEFNLIYENNDTTAFYNEKAFIGGMENIDTISYKSAIKKDPVKYIIDFNNGGIQYEAKNINDFELTVYPNPTSGNLRVQAFLPEKLDGYKIENRSLVVSVYDATGRIVTSQNGATGQMFDFDLTNLPSGAYIINVEHSEGNKKYTATERIVKE